MGPIALFDKSFLQSLSLDEAVWFDRFFMSVVCPIFYVETLGDLAKETTQGRSPAMMVRDSAAKFPEMSGHPCSFHLDLGIADLLGFHCPMDGRIPRPGGRPVNSGTIYDTSPEQAAFHRWRQEDFTEVEHISARNWRKALKDLDLTTIANELRSLGVDGKSCRTIDDAKRLAESVVNRTDRPQAVLALCMSIFGVQPHLHPQIAIRWQTAGQPSLVMFAPYAAYLLTIELFFYFALAARLIDAQRNSNRTDIAYLAYLPFCMVFISSDSLHRRCTPLFLRPDQEFVWGLDLKPALKDINLHFLHLPEDVRNDGIMRFANHPPSGNLVADLWDRHMRRGYREEEPVKLDPETAKETVRRLMAFVEEPTERVQRGPKEDEMVGIARNISVRRGSWWQMPRDSPDRK